jgi:SAM-dependent methyltransferase
MIGQDQVSDLVEDLVAVYGSSLEETLDRAAAAWVLGGAFVRFVERRVPADPGEFRAAFTRLAAQPPTARLFDEHNPVWRFTISPPAAARLAEVLRAVTITDARVLGDLYQALSSHARRTNALLQTPDFVEDLILDRTLEPAIREFGLAATRVVDPACGAGHFLVGAFHRLLGHWRAAEPHTDPAVLAARALDQVTGVDIDPVAIAIAHFRLGLAAGSGQPRLLVADALLGEHPYLHPGQYTAVVGNPPYKTVRDPALSDAYRRRWSACSRKYALTVPFAQLFFRLARPGGHVGQITASSFMRREFGRKLVTGFFATEVELHEVIDTSGAHLPGHGTPTVILIGRNRPPAPDRPIRTVLAIRGAPASGDAWSAIVDQVDRPGSESSWVSVLDADRSSLASHPWSLAGGADARLMTAMSAMPERLGERTSRIGVFGMTNADDVLVADRRTWRRRVGDLTMNRRLVVGDELRDWAVAAEGSWAFFPYDDELHLAELDRPAYARWLWPYRTVLGNRATFGRSTYFAEGRPWWSWHQLTADPHAHPWWLTYAFVATHNHFVLDRGGTVFKQSAPVIKLPATATEDDHFGLLGVLNSAAACFWLKQVNHNKGSTVDRRGARQTTVAWENFYEFGGTKLRRLPLPATFPVAEARLLDDLGRRLSATAPRAVAASGVPDPERLGEARKRWEDVLARMVAVQEELDWAVHRGYGLLDLVYEGEPPGLRLGERAFEIVLARRGETQWFDRHGGVPVTAPPAHWPPGYRAIVERRIAAIERGDAHAERPEYKRRWQGKEWAARQEEALREWLLDRLEDEHLTGAPMPIAELTRQAVRDDDFREVLALWVGGPRRSMSRTVRRLLSGECVPFRPEDRFTPTGLRKHTIWQRTWELQRRADAGEKVTIPVPPRYRAADYRKAAYWRLRGRLDVPRERFTTYPSQLIGRAAGSVILTSID